MQTTRLLVPLVFLFACASSYEPAGTPQTNLPPLEVVVLVPPAVMPPFAPRAPVAPAPLAPLQVSAFTRCLNDGGALSVVDSIDNDDTAEHGEVTAFALSEEGRLAVGTTDGTIKLWSLDGFIDVLNPGIFGYGVEIDAPPSRDLAFVGERVMSADQGGLVSLQFDVTSFSVIGGSEPGTLMTAVAVDRGGLWVAHADENARLVMRDLEFTQVLELDGTELTEIHDLAFTDGGTLIAAGSGLERWVDGERAGAWTLEGDTPIREIATRRGVLAGLGSDALRIFDDGLTLQRVIEMPAHKGLSLDLTADAAIAFTVGEEGALRAWRTEDGRELGQVAIPDPVTVRVGEELAVVASRDGMLRAVACE